MKNLRNETDDDHNPSDPIDQRSRLSDHRIGGRAGYTWGITLGDIVKCRGLCLAEGSGALENVKRELARG